MRIISISYDLKVDKSFEAYEKIISAIESLGNVEKAQYSSWVISTEYTCSQVEEYLFKYVKSMDSLMVLEVVSYAAHNVPDAVKQLMNRTWHPIKDVRLLLPPPRLAGTLPTQRRLGLQTNGLTRKLSL